MARILPIPSILMDLLIARRRFLESEVEAGNLKLPANQTIDDLPIVCHNFNYTERCNSKHLTAAGRRILKTVAIEEERLAYIDLELEQNRSAYDGTQEKDPTVYLCRRNLGTHLYVLGLTEAEIQYIMGQDINDPYESRNDFSNEDKLYQIKLKMDKRPLLNQTTSPSESSISCCESFQNCSNKTVCISSKDGFQIKLHATALIPQNNIHIDITYKNAVLHSGELYSLFEESNPNSRTVNITHIYHHIYNNILGRLESLSNKGKSSNSTDQHLG